jgi:hypothetical protein
MPEIKQLIQIKTLPGIRRDGTLLDGDNYSDGEWVRFQRGKPRKIGGYRLISDQLRGPVRNVHVWSKSQLNNIYAFSGHTIEMVQVDQNGGGSTIYDRTPGTFTGDDQLLWTTDTLFDAAAGSNKSLMLALPTKTLINIDDTTEYSLYVGDTNTTGSFTAVSDGNGVAAGGVFVTAPYAILYGKDGKVTWSNQNEPQNYTTGDAGTARVTGAKIVKGLPMRSGSGPGGIMWSLDSVVRMDYTGGQTVFKFTTLSPSSSILSQNSVVEYDGMYYWVGIDRFLVTDGSSVKEVPNNMNLNWFFDGLNHTHRQKVWGTKIPRYGEIWWFYPRGEATECSHAVVLNVREQTWYDVELARSAGYYSQVYTYPVWAGGYTAGNKLSLTMTVSSGTFAVGDNIIGTTSGASANIYFISGTNYRVTLNSDAQFIVGEGVSNVSQLGTAAPTVVTNLYELYSHEKGRNAVNGDLETAILSSFTTSDFGLPTGGFAQGDQQGVNRWTRIVRIEPDFNLTGSLNIEVLGREWAQEEDTVDGPYTVTSETARVDMRVQRRHVRLKFTNDSINGWYEMGRVILHTEPGDVRS